MANNPQIYHEKQKLQFCLIHALNNLFQEKDLFNRSELNTIAEKLVLEDPIKQIWNPLSPIFKPHHNSLTGNYDVNVLISALEGKGKKVTWHDRRNGAESIDFTRLMGIVINVSVKRFGGFWRSRHWVALREIDGVWYNLDSDFQNPRAFKDLDEFKEFLDYIIRRGAEVLLVSDETEI
ncbi:ubiquitinyl hydrolase 1 [Ranunculus cassubicifolius]